MLPNFFIAGAPKAGTTSLYRYLGQHPGIFMSANKEPHYFAEEIREENYDPALRPGMARGKGFGGIVSDWDEYVGLFAGVTSEAAVGEASVCYLWSPSAPGRIAEKIPGPRIVAMLRDPAARAFSQYLHGLGNGAIRWSFREHIERNQRHGSKQLCVHYPFLEFGRYASQIARYREHFGQNVWVGLHEDFTARPVELVREICRFLGVTSEFSPDMAERHLQAQVPKSGAIGWLRQSGWWEAAAKVTPAGLRPLIRRSLIRKPGTTRMEAADRQYLVDYYRGETRRLETMLGRDLRAWLTY